MKKQGAVEKIFLVNAGLDVAYIAGGLYLKEKSVNSAGNASRLKGYGESIMLQGSVLLFFDAIMYGIHNKNGKNLFLLGDKMKISSYGHAVKISMDL